MTKKIIKLELDGFDMDFNNLKKNEDWRLNNNVYLKTLG